MPWLSLALALDSGWDTTPEVGVGGVYDTNPYRLAQSPTPGWAVTARPQFSTRQSSGDGRVFLFGQTEVRQWIPLDMDVPRFDDTQFTAAIYRGPWTGRQLRLDLDVHQSVADGWLDHPQRLVSGTRVRVSPGLRWPVADRATVEVAVPLGLARYVQGGQVVQARHSIGAEATASVLLDEWYVAANLRASAFDYRHNTLAGPGPAWGFAAPTVSLDDGLLVEGDVDFSWFGPRLYAMGWSGLTLLVYNGRPLVRPIGGLMVGGARTVDWSAHVSRDTADHWFTQTYTADSVWLTLGVDSTALEVRTEAFIERALLEGELSWGEWYVGGEASLQVGRGWVQPRATAAWIRRASDGAVSVLPQIEYDQAQLRLELVVTPPE